MRKLKKEIVNFKTNYSRSKKPRVYLAGNMENIPDGGADWRKKLDIYLQKFNIECFDPCQKISDNNETDLFEIIKTKPFDLNLVKSMVNGIITEDIYEVLSSDLIVCKWNNKMFSAGTSGELTVAKIFNIPVIVVVEDIYDMPKWALGCTDIHKTNFDNIEVDINKLLKILK